MKLIIRYCLPWGNFTTQALQIDAGADVTTLQTKITEKFGIKKSHQILTFKRDGFTLRLVEGWPLSYFEIKDKSVIFLEKYDTQPEDEDFVIDMSKNRGGYFAKLGIINKIEEELDEDEGTTVDSSSKHKQNRLSYPGSGLGSDATSDALLSSDEEGTKDHVKLARIRNETKNILKDVKDGNLEKIKEIFALYDGQKDKQTEIEKLINKKGETGWNLLHWAIYNGHLAVVKELLQYDMEVNAVSDDGWTPLQLAVHKNYLEIVKRLLQQKDIKINQITAKGTALHIAAKNGRVEIVAALLGQGADVKVKDKEDMIPFEVTTNDKVKRLIEFAAVKKAEEEFKPPKPPIVKGFLLKQGTYLMKLNRRFMVLNPDEGTLIRYKKREDYPLKPKEIIPLKAIEGVRRKKAGPFADKNLYYIQLMYQKRYIMACYNEETANKWVTYILQGTVYANYIENKMQKQQTPNGIDSEIYNYFGNTTNEEVMLEDNSPKLKDSGSNSSPLQVKPVGLDDSKLKKKREKKNVEASAPLITFKSFEILAVLGAGAFGRVYKVMKKDTKEIFAMKALKKRNLILKNQLRYAVTEANVLKMSKHPFVLGLHYSFQTPQNLYLVLDYCPGGDLSLHLANKGIFTEDETRFYIAELILAVEYLHSKDVIYRDLKPENILLDKEGHVKLADFGLAKEGVGNNDVTTSFCGSPAYLSPEMVKKRGVGKSADIYGIGTVVYELLTGEAPYYNDDIPKLYSNIVRGKLDMPATLSPEAKDLMIKLLDRDPEHRPGVKDRNDLRNHPFFKGIDWEKLERREIEPPKLEALENNDDDDGSPAAKNQINDTDYTEKNKKINRVKAFTFIRNKEE